MFYGIPVVTTMENFYAWSPSEQGHTPEWIDDVFPNAVNDNYIVYTKEPMKKFLVSPNEVIIRCGVGSAVFFLVLKKDMMRNWWKINERVANEFEDCRPLFETTYKEYADKHIFSK